MHQARAVRGAEAQGVEQRIEMVGDAGPALHRQAVRLVDRDQVVVAIEHEALEVLLDQRVDLGWWLGDFGLGGREWRDAHGLAGGEAGGGVGTMAVHADLTGAA